MIDVVTGPNKTYWLHRARKWVSVIDFIRSEEKESGDESDSEDSSEDENNDTIVGPFLKSLQSVILRVSRKKDEPWELKLSKGGSMNKEVLCGKVHDSVPDKDVPAFIQGIFSDFFPELCVQESYRLMYLSTSMNKDAETYLASPPKEKKKGKKDNRRGEYWKKMMGGLEAKPKVIFKKCLSDVLVSESIAEVLNTYSKSGNVDEDDVQRKKIQKRFRSIVYGEK